MATAECERVLESLRHRGTQEAEVFVKTGRSRRYEVGPQGKTGSSASERGWAVRGGSSRASFFVAGTGRPRGELEGVEADGQPLRLPPAQEIPVWTPPADLDISLVGESEAFALLEAVERALDGELPGCRMLQGRLEEGTSETSISSSRGIDVSFRSRAAQLHVEFVGPRPASTSAALSLAERSHRDFQPTAIAKRLANRLALSRHTETPPRERGDMLLASAVTRRLLVSLLPLLIGGDARPLARRLQDRQGRLGSEHLTIIDDGRLPAGVLNSPVDGEGVPTAAVNLIEVGRFVQPLQSWREKGEAQGALQGTARRDSWRDLPETSPSHLFIEPRAGVGVRDLVSSIARGFYLVEPLGPAVFEFERDRFRIPVCGFVLSQGKATAPLSGVWVEGAIGALLRNIQAVARDLGFEPLGAMIGAPTILVGGLGLRRMS